MSYAITINKVTREMVKEREFVGNDDERANEGGYWNHETEKDIERTVYTQIVDNLNLIDVISAVNTKESK